MSIMMKWLKLDNAAIVFPQTASDRNSSVFRIAAVLREAVDPAALQVALDRTIERYPMMNVDLRAGAFWHYLDRVKQRLLVMPELDYPCFPFYPEDTKGSLIKVLYHNCRVSLEFFHSVTDGGGAMEFLKTLLYCYAQTLGRNPGQAPGLLLPDDPVTQPELEDSFKRHYRPEATLPGRGVKAYGIKGSTFMHGGNAVLHGVVSSLALNAAAKRHGGTITSYLTALLIDAVEASAPASKKIKKPVVVSVPISLRRFYGSKTLRNFFAVANIDAGPEESWKGGAGPHRDGVRPSRNPEELDRLVAAVDKSLKEKTAKDYLDGLVAANVRLEANLATRFVPLLLKRFFVSAGFSLLGENRKTITLSNLGIITLPEGLKELVAHMEVLLYPTPKSPLNCSVCATGDSLVISFIRTIEETDVPSHFFSRLTEGDGLKLELYSNAWEDL